MGKSKDLSVAEAITAATGIQVSDEDILGQRTEPTGDVIAVTNQGQKVRITTDGEVQVLLGPGSPVEEIFEPPIPDDAPVEDLPPLTASDDQDTDDDTQPAGSTDHFELFKGEDKQFYFRRVAENGETVAASEGYKRLKDAAAEAERQADGLEVVKV